MRSHPTGLAAAFTLANPAASAHLPSAVASAALSAPLAGSGEESEEERRLREENAVLRERLAEAEARAGQAAEAVREAVEQVCV